jgi:hypothetical protein
VGHWRPVMVGIVAGAAVYAVEWLLGVPAGYAFGDAALVAFATLLILGWRWR